MNINVLKNKGKLILKKREKLIEDVANRLTDEGTRIQLNLLEDAFSKYSDTYDEKSAEADDDQTGKFIDDWELVSDYYMNAKSVLVNQL